MSIFDVKQLNKEHLKVRWREPYVSAALNKSKFGVEPRGIYAGFNIIPVGYRSYRVSGSVDPIPFHGDSDSYNRDGYSSVSGYSIAVHDDTLGHSTTVSIPPNDVSGTFDFDFTGVDDEQRILAIDVDYLIGNETAGQVVAIDSLEMSAHPDYLVIGVINLPSNGVSGSTADIDYSDSIYPRALPFANPRKYGYMSPEQASVLLGIGDEADTIYCSPNDANIWWRIISSDIGRLDFTGTIDFNVPTSDFNVNIANAGDVVSGIADNDVLYFIYPNDGGVTGATLQIAPNNNLPKPLPEEQLIVFGMRCGSDFWFKNGQKWEVGEFKPFGVTSKYPNLKVGETGNPPQSESVSGIFFDNATVSVLPGGRDVRVYVNVSGCIPPEPIEDELVAYEGQTSFTVVNPDLFWVLDDVRRDISVFKNGVKLIPYLDSTSGLTYSTLDPVWEYRKSGTRSIELREPCKEDSVITVRLEADHGYYADEEYFLVDSVSGFQMITTVRPFQPNNVIPDITLWRNGVKVEYADFPLNPKIHGASKISDKDIWFETPVPFDSVIVVRWESNLALFNPAGGIHWYDPVDSDVNPLTDDYYNLGNVKRFKTFNVSQDIGIGGDIHIGGKIYVSGGIDPTYIEFTPSPETIVPNNSVFVDYMNGNALSFKDTLGTVIPIIQSGASGVNLEEEELMINPYPFAITAPKAISVSGIGNYMVLTDYNDGQLLDDFFGILSHNVSAFGTPGLDVAAVRWRGRMNLVGYNNGAVYVSGLGDLVQSAPSVSGMGILKPGIVKNNVMFLRPTEGFTL